MKWKAGGGFLVSKLFDATGIIPVALAVCEEMFNLLQVLPR